MMKVIRSLTLLALLGLLSACFPVLPVTGGAVPTSTLVSTVTIPTSQPAIIAPPAITAPASATPPPPTPAPTMTMSMAMPTTASQATVPANSTQSEGVQQVTIANLAFSPAVLTVSTGTKVTWTNNDQVAHTVTADNGSFNSGPLNPGMQFSFTFNQPGTFSYHCMIHPNMVAKVIVNAGGASAPVMSAPASLSQANQSGSNVGGLPISIANFAFTPATLSVPVGTKVRWTNNDATQHTVTADSGTFNSGPLNPGATFAVDFSQPGTYTYQCQIHPNMLGTIIVTGAGATSSGSSTSGGMNGSSTGGSSGGSGGMGGYSH